MLPFWVLVLLAFGRIYLQWCDYSFTPDVLTTREQRTQTLKLIKLVLKTTMCFTRAVAPAAECGVVPTTHSTALYTEIAWIWLWDLVFAGFYVPSTKSSCE